MNERMQNKKVHDRRKIKLDKVMSREYIPFLSGRPKRETVINRDDILNLSITLNTVNSVDEIIKNI